MPRPGSAPVRCGYSPRLLNNPVVVFRSAFTGCSRFPLPRSPPLPAAAPVPLPRSPLLRPLTGPARRRPRSRWGR